MQQILKFSYLLIVILVGQSCQPAHPQRIAYETPDSQSFITDWKEFLAQSPKIDSFKTLKTGLVKVPTKGMLNKRKLPIDHPFGSFIWVEVYAHLFHHQKYGWFLIDTGLDQSFQQKGNVKGIMAGKFIKDSQQAKGENIGAQLDKEQKEIQGIFITHLHGDHTAGLPELDRSIPKYVGKGESHIQLPLLYHSEHLSNRDTLLEIDWEQGMKIAPFDSVVDIFGDASFFAIHTPGHSNSHLSYLMMSSEGPVLLTGDASHTKYGFVNEIEPGWVQDRNLAFQSLMQLKTFATNHPSVKIIYGHER